MSNEIKIPDIGDVDAVDVVEILVKPGDQVAQEDSIIVLESDKASMEVPASQAGVIESLSVKVGDQVKQGDVIGFYKQNDGESEKSAPAAEKEVSSDTNEMAATDIKVPDIGEDTVDVIEINVAEGDNVSENDPLITLESEKASMEVPAEISGTIVKLSVKVGDKVKTGSIIGQISIQAKPEKVTDSAQKADLTSKEQSVPDNKSPAEASKSSAQTPPNQKANIDQTAFDTAYASPSVRKFARELGADLGKISGTGRQGRVVIEDVKGFVKQALTTENAERMTSGIPAVPAVDFSKFGETEEQKLSRINILTGEAMKRCWLNIPHVTQHDMCDITELEAFRKSLQKEAEKQGVKVTMLAFLMKALASGLQTFPRFNSSLSADGKNLILKKYINIGVAVDTPNGLVVPVIKSVANKGIYELSKDLMEISAKAREGKLSPKDMSGASMTISSLGGIGGQYFTPIVNAPEVAILGVSRSSMQPVWDGKNFIPRLMLPLSLSYDHRVIDGALGARMTVYLGQILSDMRRSIL